MAKDLRGKEGGPCGPKRGGGWMTHDSGRKVEKEDDMMGEGPIPVKPRVAEKDEVVRASLIRAL
jgi:hypothetical protein